MVTANFDISFSPFLWCNEVFLSSSTAFRVLAKWGLMISTDTVLQRFGFSCLFLSKCTLSRTIMEVQNSCMDNLFKVIVTLYCGKPPFNHKLGKYFFTCSKHLLSKSKKFDYNWRHLIFHFHDSCFVQVFVHSPGAIISFALFFFHVMSCLCLFLYRLMDLHILNVRTRWAHTSYKRGYNI